jgi:hypothetical protein
MIKKLFILASVIVLVIVVGFIALDSGWVFVPEWYQKTNRFGKKAMRTTMINSASYFAKHKSVPNSDAGEILYDDAEFWGTPVLYSYENGEPTIRAAGKDRTLNTKDDLIQKVCITNQVTLRDDAVR